MVKKVLAILLIALMVFTFCACGKVTLHCDGCGKEVKCDSKIDEDWIIFSAECEKELDLDFVE